MTHLRLTPTGPVWPYSDAQLRADEPATLFPSVLTAADRAAFRVVEPQPIDPPSYDPATERIEEVHPVLVGDAWTQAWAVVPLSPEEQEAHLQVNRPAPDWAAFKAALLASPDVNAALAAAATVTPAAALALPAALIAMADGRGHGDFRACWVALRRAGLIPVALLDQVWTAAVACHLPDDALAAIGTRQRAREADGTYRADDPATPQDEAWAWVES